MPRKHTPARLRNQSLPPDPLADDPFSPLFVLFRPIPEWFGYGADTDGNVWSCWTSSGETCSEWKLRKPVERKSGHRFVMLYRHGHGHFRPIHQLVLEAFVGPRPHGLQCRHLNGQPADNRLINLAWGTPKENAEDSVLHGVTPRGSKVVGSKLTEGQVAEIRSLLAAGRIRRDIAHAFGVSEGAIGFIEDGTTWRHVPVNSAPQPSAYRPGKLSESNVQEIRRMAGTGMLQREIAKSIGVTQGAVSRVLNGKAWASCQ